jgi:hypothetical protein
MESNSLVSIKDFLDRYKIHLSISAGLVGIAVVGFFMRKKIKAVYNFVVGLLPENKKLKNLRREQQEFRQEVDDLQKRVQYAAELIDEVKESSANLVEKDKQLNVRLNNLEIKITKTGEAMNSVDKSIAGQKKYLEQLRINNKDLNELSIWKKELEKKFFLNRLKTTRDNILHVNEQLAYIVYSDKPKIFKIPDPDTGEIYECELWRIISLIDFIYGALDQDFIYKLEVYDENTQNIVASRLVMLDANGDRKEIPFTIGELKKMGDCLRMIYDTRDKSQEKKELAHFLNRFAEKNSEVKTIEESGEKIEVIENNSENVTNKDIKSILDWADKAYTNEDISKHKDAVREFLKLYKECIIRCIVVPNEIEYQGDSVNQNKESALVPQ